MSQDKDLSDLSPVEVDQGKCQWVRCTITGIDTTQEERTHTAAVPHLMPGTTIFVHGVNSEGEWYNDASIEFAKGLNKRLGREDLKRLLADQSSSVDGRKPIRYRKYGDAQKRIPSPIIPFWWGYKTTDTERKLVKGSDQTGNTPAHTDFYGNPLRSDGAWGGGPFQNGGGSLSAFWLPTGFRKDVGGGVLDLNTVNPIVGRRLCDCPPRLYYAHAARRLAYLIKDIRRNLPNEPINIVSHSQGTIVSLCALFFLDGERAPDTVILNSSPYRFEVRETDHWSASDGKRSVQPEAARVATFVNAAAIVAGATRGYPEPPASKADCAVVHKPCHAYDDALFAHKPTDAPQWQAEIGGKVEEPAGPRGQDGKPWWKVPKFERSDTRGKLMVNFNPGDRVIGLDSVSGMGWRGIPSRYRDAIGSNVQQRMFARGTDGDHNPAVGSQTGYLQRYFYKPTPPASGSATPGSAGGARQAGENQQGWRHLSGNAPEQQWSQPSEKTWGIWTVLGEMSPGKNDEQAVYINAPVVPRPVELPQEFDGGYVMYDGRTGADPDGKPVRDDAQQKEDFDDDVTFQERQTVMERDEKGLPGPLRYETWLEVERRRQNKVGRVPVPPTNHAAILRFKNQEQDSSPVADVLSYDLTVGQGYAWHDENYWNYLLDLADWKKSDPYYRTGRLPDSDKNMPAGIVAGNGQAASAPETQPHRLPSTKGGR